MAKKRIKSGPSAQQLLDLLAQRHGDDVFVPECKDGPTWGGKHGRMDAWAMRKSWARPHTWAYEIKVSRSDFTRDKKWDGYLAFCNSFYFVCPGGLLRAEEIPAPAGLLWASANGRRLYTKKRADIRDGETPDVLYRYILMSRAQITDSRTSHSSGDWSSADYWRRWIKKRDEEKELGHRVSRKIQKLVLTQITKVATESNRLRKENKELSDIREVLKRAGMFPLPYFIDTQLAAAKVREKMVGVLNGTLPALDRAKRAIEIAEEAIRSTTDQEE